MSLVNELLNSIAALLLSAFLLLSNFWHQNFLPPTPAPTLNTASFMVVNEAPVATKAAMPRLLATDPGPWGVAKQLDEHTWTIKLEPDEHMATPQEIFSALNSYRAAKGRLPLAWSDNLAAYALERAKYFTILGSLDGHAGFNTFLQNEDNFTKLGFTKLGENSAYGYRMTGVHLIEWVFAGDKPHDDNQLSSDWSHVGIGVNGKESNLIFGGSRL